MSTNNTLCTLCTTSIAYRILNLKKCDAACKGSTVAADLQCPLCVSSPAYYAAHASDCDRACGQAYKSHTLNCALCTSSPVYRAIRRHECDAQCNQAAHDVIKDAASSASPIGGLFQQSLWLRVAEVGLGIVLIAVGVAKLTNAVPIATKIARYAA